ncbi:conserved hypothetical protein [Methanosalsum zhilinae DSM 4017]|uniref:Regulatory protein, FmdB family n=1 Tax=Methanosalsum zhilinae (strain DSM 4017 / NBRC 107636 / OCM 62 / WeN5) TaxID=679901 RepID=F7XL73_METZD|nr:hypothetical protein [Methanosalsum zhilinae]AEH60195.1 conserved hypothetical protein [Methanosalsum zhilinae DSM 4017]
MCSVGDSYDLNIDEQIPAKKYTCNECNNKFKGIGKNVACPSCGSKNVREQD